MVESRPERALLIFSLAPPGQRDQPYSRPPRFSPQGLRDVVTIEVGHTDVEQSHVGTKRLRQRERGAAAVRDTQLVAGKAKQHTQRLSRILVVIDDEDPAPPAGLRYALARRRNPCGRFRGRERQGDRYRACLTATPMTSTCAPRCSAEVPMNARAGNGAWKYVR
jgi:hypothetical protein